MSELLAQSLPSLVQQLQQGTVHARDLVEEAIANHERWGALLNAYLLWTPTRARRAGAKGRKKPARKAS